MERKTIAIIAACILLYLLWWPILDRLGLGKYNPSHRVPVAVDTTHGARKNAPAAGAPAATPAPASSAPAGAAGSGAPATLSALPFRPTEQALERSYVIETPLYRANFSNQGARLLSIELKRYASAHGVSNLSARARQPKHGEEVPAGDRVVLAGDPTFELSLGSGAALRSLARVPFAAAESLDAAGDVRALTFTARDSAGMLVRETWRVRPSSYALDLEVEIHRVPEAWRVSEYSLTMRSWPLVTERDFQSDDRVLRACSLVGTKIYREAAQSLRRGPSTHDGNVAWAGVQNRYFLAVAGVAQGAAHGAIASSDQRLIPDATLRMLTAGAKPIQNVAVNQLILALPGESSPVNRFVVYLGPSDYAMLSKVGEAQLVRAQDLGWGWLLPINHVMLGVLDWLFALTRNYGLAIILLATLVRVLLHPLNMTSMRSMRAMQKVQPEMDRLREKYKDDAQAMNTAVMALYKENNVNPAGGCLPMLLQMPVLFSLFQVLSNAIHLRQAPFVGWMGDLSAPDVLMTVGTFPIHLLPVIMALTGLLLQRFTPTNPQQAPSAYMMNVLMLVFFYGMPSGLVLYWTVMNLLSAIQQWLVLRQDGGEPVVVRTGEPEKPAKKPKARRG